MLIWLLIRQNAIPEVIMALIMFTRGMEIEELPFRFLLFLIYSVLLRLIWNISIFIHGLGHTLAIATVDRQMSAFNISNILEHRSIAMILKSLLPFNQIFIPFFNCESALWVAAGNSTREGIRIKALGGIFFNFLAIAITFICFSNGLNSFLLTHGNVYGLAQVFISQAFISANLIIALCSLSDMRALVTGVADYFYCGNFGFIGKRNPDDGNQLLPARMVQIAQQMGSETEIRGEQAGGGLVSGRDSEQVVFVGKKIVNRKRDNLTKSLEAAFAPVRKKAIAQGITPSRLIMGVWHYRYATSGSPPSEMETHWHEWMGTRKAKVCQFNNGKWQYQTKNVNHRITHNGDFDSWRMFGKEIDNTTLGLWLERVLHTPNSTKGDSPKIAGMIDLLMTQGMWYPSVRLAYQQANALGIESAFGTEAPSRNAPNTAPSVEYLTHWAEIFENIFALYQRLLPKPDSPSYTKYLSYLEEDVLQVTARDSSMAQWSEPNRVSFVKTAIRAFLYNDLYRATQIFMSRAKGSFGLVTVSTLEPEQLVLSAKGQPITIGFNWHQGYMVYASEPSAVDRVLLGSPESYRLDLNQKEGEIAKVSAENLTIYSIHHKRKLTPLEIENRWISMENHPYLSYIQASQTDKQDPVASDIQSIPRVLNQIETSWQNPASLNRQSADYLLSLLIKKVQHFDHKQQKMLQAGFISRLRQMPTTDLLITGEENSLWLGERFAQDLKIIFPLLNVITISANQVLQQLSQDLSQLSLNKNSLILAITQSGQTFSTVQAINTFDHLCSQGVIGELFILTGELSSFINSTQGHDRITTNSSSPFLDNPHYPRIFVNGSGRRTTEPSTVSVAAAQQTLTKLLFYLAKQIRKKFPDVSPFGMTLTQESLMALEMVEKDFLDQTVVQIVGATANGEIIKSSIKQKLIKGGHYWAMHVTETPLVWAIHALYVLVTVGWAIPFGYTIPLVQTLLGLIFSVVNLPQGLFELIAPIATKADIIIYIFGPWLWTLLLRYFQGRQLLARMGKRTLVIGDDSWVHKLLQSYVSKLFSLSYGIASIEVHGANPQNDLLHAFAHRVVRGTLIFLGVPDGRRSQKLQKRENAVLMTGKQANSVRHVNVGPEIVVMGHNPAIVKSGLMRSSSKTPLRRIPIGNITNQGFSNVIILESHDDLSYLKNLTIAKQKGQIENLREARFGAFERLLASYIFFWALAKKVASFPMLKYEFWKSQSRTKIMTTASPVPGLEIFN